MFSKPNRVLTYFHGEEVRNLVSTEPIHENPVQMLQEFESRINIQTLQASLDLLNEIIGTNPRARNLLYEIGYFLFHLANREQSQDIFYPESIESFYTDFRINNINYLGKFFILFNRNNNEKSINSIVFIDGAAIHSIYLEDNDVVRLQVIALSSKGNKTDFVKSGAIRIKAFSLPYVFGIADTELFGPKEIIEKIEFESKY